jgi:hypothetical protein
MAWHSAADLTANIEVRCFSKKQAKAVCRARLPRSWKIQAVAFQDYKPRPEEKTAEVLAFIEACRQRRKLAASFSIEFSRFR